jgi:hypothetical protein
MIKALLSVSFIYKPEKIIIITKPTDILPILLWLPMAKDMASDEY